MKALVTGAAGFIGSNLADRLLGDGHFVRGFDNFSTGRLEFLDKARRSSSFELCRGDLLEESALDLAANADVRNEREHPRKDLEQKTIGAANVLKAMRACGEKGIAFPSTGSVYGEPEVFPTHDNCALPSPDVTVRRLKARGGSIDGGLQRSVRHAWLNPSTCYHCRRSLHPPTRFRFRQTAAAASGRVAGTEQ